MATHTTVITRSAGSGEFLGKKVDQTNALVAGTGSWSMKLADLSGKEAKFREVAVCLQGNRKKAIALITEYYD